MAAPEQIDVRFVLNLLLKESKLRDSLMLLVRFSKCFIPPNLNVICPVSRLYFGKYRCLLLLVLWVWIWLLVLNISFRYDVTMNNVVNLDASKVIYMHIYRHASTLMSGIILDKSFIFKVKNGFCIHRYHFVQLNK